MAENSLTIALDMLIEPDAGANFGQHARERDLADLKRIAPQVVAVQLDQVERVEKHAAVSAVMTDEIERGDAIVIAGDSFAVDDARARAQAGQRFDDQREATAEVITRRAISLFSPRTNARAIARLRPGITGRDYTRRPWQVRQYAWR
jgi:hypothetical protein